MEKPDLVKIICTNLVGQNKHLFNGPYHFHSLVSMVQSQTEQENEQDLLLINQDFEAGVGCRSKPSYGSKTAARPGQLMCNMLWHS